MKTYLSKASKNVDITRVVKRTSVASCFITNYTKRNSKIDHVRKVDLHAAFQSR